MIKTHLAFASFLWLSLGCERHESTKGIDPFSESKIVLTTFYPTTYFAQRLAGDHLDIRCPLPAGADPIFWMPNTTTIQAYQNATLIILNGASFEKWVDKVSLPHSKVIESAKPLEKDLLRYEEIVQHRHGPEGEHSHFGIDGHTWLDPLNALIQAQEIAAALAKRWPEHASSIEEQLVLLEADLSALDKRFRDFTRAWGKQAMLASHPAYNYLAKRYGLNIVNLDLDPDHMEIDNLPEIASRAKEHDTSILLWESPPSDEIVARLEEIGLESTLISPAEGEPEVGDYLSVMRDNLARLEALLNE